MFKNKLAVLQNLCAVIYSNKLQKYLFQQMPPEGTFSEEMKNFMAFFLSLLNCVSILHYTLYSLSF